MKNPGYEKKNFLVKRPLLELFTQLYFIHSYIVDKSQIPTFQSRPYLNKVPKLWGEKLGTPPISYIVDKSQIPTFQSRPYLNKVHKLWEEKLGTPPY
jgi:hypothetical protein